MKAARPSSAARAAPGAISAILFARPALAFALALVPAALALLAAAEVADAALCALDK